MPITILTFGWLIVFSINEKPWKGKAQMSMEYFVALIACIFVDIMLNI